jgi:hypothetical protein
MEDVETIKLLFRRDGVDTSDDVGTIESVETIELLFIANDVDTIEEDSELWTNWYADGEGAVDDAAAVIEML